MNPVYGIGYPVFLAVFLAGVACFALRLKNKWLLLRSAAPEGRSGDWWARSRSVLRHAALQCRILKDPATGLMHAFIFWGFCALSLQTADLFFGTLLKLDLTGWMGRWYGCPKDLFVVLVSAMAVYAIFRRAVLRPARVEGSGEAYLVLGMILALMLTDAGMAAAEAAASPDRADGFLGLWLGPLLSGCNAAGNAVIYSFCFWLHALCLLAFLNILPGSKHFHVVTSLPNVFFRKLTPMGSLRPLDLGDESAETFGVHRAEELGWKVVLDLFSCTECGRCHEHCPTHSTGKPLSPKRMNDHIKKFVHAHEKELVARQADGIPDLFQSGTVGEDEIWACTTCGFCEKACPLFIEEIQWVVDFRRYKTLTESDFPEELTKAFRGIETQGNPWGLGAHRRLEWAEGLDTPVAGGAESFEYLYFVGCSGSFDDRNKAVARAFVQLLNLAGVSFAVLGEAECCCGDAARRTGNEYLFQTVAQANIEAFHAAGVKKILTTCPHGYNTLKNEYPQFGGDFEVYHHAEFLDALVREGRLKPTRELAATVSYHDSCYLGRYNGIFDQPRRSLLSVPGIRLAEPLLSRDRGFCCGGGGGRAFMEEKIGERISHRRVSQIRETGCQLAVTACPFCMTMLADGVKEKGIGDMGVKDLAEVLWESTGGGTPPPPV